MFKAMPALARNIRRHSLTQRGQTLVECTLVMSFLSLCSVVLMSIMGAQMTGLYTSFVNGVSLFCGSL